jgi:exonuclease SbcC
MITRVSLKNWKSHIDSEFRFTPGVNALMGIMGSGKTSVMQAISFALFGTFSGLQSKRIKIDNLIMSKPQKKSQAEVELDFVLGRDTYSVKRIVKAGKGTTTAELRKNGDLVEVNPQSVTNEVERILQVDYDLFSRAVYSEQDGLDYFLRIPKGQRMGQIDKMLKLDRFETARERCVSMKNRITDARKEKIRYVAELEKENLRERIDDLSQEISDLRKSMDGLHGDSDRVRQLKNALAGKVSGFEETESEHNRTKSRLEGLGSSIKEIESQLLDKKRKIRGRKIEYIVTGFNSVKSEIARIEAEIEKETLHEKEYRDQLASMNTRIMVLEKDTVQKLRERLASMDKDLSRMKELERRLGSSPEETISSRRKELDGIRDEVYNLEASVKEISRNLEDLRKVEATCPVCDSHISADKKKGVIEKREGLVRSLEKEIEKRKSAMTKTQDALEVFESGFREHSLLRERLRDLGKTRGELENGEKEVSENRERVKSVVSELEKLRKLVDGYRNDLRKRNEEKEQLNVMFSEIDSIKGLEERRKNYLGEMNSLKERAGVLSAQLKAVNIKSLRNELERAIARESEILTTISSVREKLSDREGVSADLKKRNELLESYRKEVSTDEAVVYKLETFVKVLKVTQDQLREEFLKTVNYIMNRVWGDLYPYGDFSEIKLVVEEGDYVLKLKGIDGWISVDGIASGGERTMSVLALRIAFSLAFIPNLRWLILDEPTHNLDVNAISQFEAVLRENMGAFAEQVFLITHEERIASGITGALYRLERNKAVNEATRVKTNE